jgi:isopropylmalate/homocitrate/citramalate synthase
MEVKTRGYALFAVHPALVGYEQSQIVMGKKGGLDNVYLWPEKLKIELNEDEAMLVLKKVKLQSHDLTHVLREVDFLGDSEKNENKSRKKHLNDFKG